MSTMKTSYSLQKLRGVELFCALETWQVILSMTNGTLTEEDIQEEAERIVIAAANIIRAEIREKSTIQSHTPLMKILLMLIRAGNGSHTIYKTYCAISALAILFYNVLGQGQL